MKGLIVNNTAYNLPLSLPLHAVDEFIEIMQRLIKDDEDIFGIIKFVGGERLTYTKSIIKSLCT